MDLGIKDKVAVVLASTKGLGRACAAALLEEGARVAVSGRDPKGVEAACADLDRAHGDRVWGEALDVSVDADLEGHLQRVRERWGAVHILVLNAGGPPPGPAAGIDLAQLDAAYRLTLRSAIVAVKAVLPGMRAQKWGRIVALTSTSVRQPIPNLTLSNTLRVGLAGFLKTLSQEVAAEGVLVNTVATGTFATDRLQSLFEDRGKRSGRGAAEEKALAEGNIPVRRLGRPEELAGVVAFLASERASYLNGVALSVDGGAVLGLL